MSEECKISISDVNGALTTVSVPISSLQTVTNFIVSTPNINDEQNLNLEFNQKVINVENVTDLDEKFDQQKWIWDDLTFVMYVKRFWNIPSKFI